MFTKKSIILMRQCALINRKSYQKFFFAKNEKFTVEQDIPRNESSKKNQSDGETITIGGSDNVISKPAFTYSPIKQIIFTDKKFIVFDSTFSERENIVGPVPYEIKDASVKSFLGVLFSLYLQYNFSLSFAVPAAPFFLFWIYRVQNYMRNAIVKMELDENGNDLTLTLKTGSIIHTKVQDMIKLREEKTLVETFDEPYLFPVDIKLHEEKKRTLYFYARGQEAIKDGEIFRAIINGRPLEI